MSYFKQRLKSSVLWNLILLTLGAALFSLGLTGIAIPYGFITGGMSGLGLLLYYATDVLSPGIWYLIINVPLFIVGWIFISKRFFFYSLYGMLACSIFMDLFTCQILIKDPFLAVLACGSILGAGGGLALHSLGSLGGMDIICIIVNQKLGIRIGTFLFGFNLVLFTFSFGFLENDLVLYSIALSFIVSQVLENVLTMFNQRKMVLIVSEFSDRIAPVIYNRLKQGSTFLNGMGAYSGKEKKILLTVVHNHQIKRLEEAVLNIDANAFMITENTFDVLGKGFSKPKVY
ncbi:MAG: YitT family protein [Desulfobacterium sp.]|nr:YitT family protein [Desulfobacterium sp.]